MGIRISRISRSTAALLRPPPPSRASSDPTPNSTSAAAGHSSPDLSSDDVEPDSSVQLRTSHAINSIAVSINAPEVSLDALSQVSYSNFETNQQVVRAVLLNKRYVWKNTELSDLVDDYFESSLATLDFCTKLDACLQRAGHIESIITLALRRFQEEHYSTNEEGIEKNYSKTLNELGNIFTAAGDPFTEDFLELSTSIYSRQIGMFKRLQAMKPKLDQKLKRLKARRRVSNFIFIAASAFVLIFSVVAAAVSAPPLVTALVAAASVPLGSIGKWLNTIWKRYERDLWKQMEIINIMYIGIVLNDVDSIKRLVERFQIVAGDLVAKDDSPTRRDAAVEEVKQKVDSFIKIIQDMRERAHNCSQETRMARISIMRKIINHPSSSNQEIGTFSES